MEVGNGVNRLDRKRTMTMNWAGLGDFEDDDDRFFETHDRLSSALSFDMAASSSDEDEDFDDCRISFSSAVSSLTSVSNAGDVDLRASSSSTPRDGARQQQIYARCCLNSSRGLKYDHNKYICVVLNLKASRGPSSFRCQRGSCRNPCFTTPNPLLLCF